MQNLEKIACEKTGLIHISKETLRLQSAEHSLGTLSPETMQASISSLMDQGFFSENCLDVLTANPPTFDDVLATFLEALAYAGVPQYSASDAVFILSGNYIRPIAEGTVDPADGLHQLMENLVWNYGFRFQEGAHVERHGLQYLQGVYYCCDDLSDMTDPRWQYRSELIVQYAKTWMRTYSPILDVSELGT
jgi:hypothetical protein